MTTLQEYLDNNYPNKAERGGVMLLPDMKLLDGGELDLSDYFSLEKIHIDGKLLKTPLTKIKLGRHSKLYSIWFTNADLTTIDLSGCSKLNFLYICNSKIVSVDFLRQLPNPQILRSLNIANNNIQPTDIEIFRQLINIEGLQMGTERSAFELGKHNQFFGSFESWKDLDKLKQLCVETTDVYGGLEYLPPYLNQFDCSPNDTDAKCKFIQDELRGFNYNLRSWQLAHPELMKKANEKNFSDWDKYKIEVEEKIKETKQELELIDSSPIPPTKKKERLKNKLKELQKVKETLDKSTQTQIFTADKETQTELTKEVITDLLQKLEVNK